jgi:hypothetical protein
MKINRALADQYKSADLLGLDEERYHLEMIKDSKIRTIAENILELIENTFFESYNTMSKLDKQLVYAYWIKIDGEPNETHSEEYKDWFFNKCTNPEDISRARRWLLEHNFIIVKSDVAKNAQEAGKNKARSF